MNPKIHISNFDQNDWPDIAAIYQESIDTGIATFETEVPDWNSWNENHIFSCRLKAVIQNQLIGWAALSPTSIRFVYKGVAEVSIYITSKYRGFGIGKLLLAKLISESENEGFWTLQASIFSKNKASIQLHQSQGFRMMGYREKIGQRKGIWYNNIVLEKRSNII